MTDLLAGYRMVWKRRRLLWRAFRARHQLAFISGPQKTLPKSAVLVFMCVRNEMGRLPFALEYYRRLGAARFFIIDNDSTDDTAAFLKSAPDVCLWHTKGSYRETRFGLDWINWLLMRFGHDHWCLHVDADELLVYAHHETRDLPALTRWLDQSGRRALGALMLDLYPDGPLGDGPMPENPLAYLQRFDAGPYRAVRQAPLQNLWVQGGARERVFFAGNPRQSPTLNKLPLVRWSRRYAYVNSTHSMLPRRMNHLYDGPGGRTPSGVLLHTKFLPEVTQKADEDLTRQQHFHSPEAFQGYYADIKARPVLVHDGSERYTGWQQLAALKLLEPGGFS